MSQRNNIKTKTLKNGATILMAPREHTHLTTILVGFRVGSNYEKDGQHGLAHFYEHMCFKGTEKYPTPFEFVNAIEMMGGSANAFTANDVTAYYITVPSKQLKRAIGLVGEMIQTPVFKTEELERERGVILSEMRLYKDDPWFVADEQLEELLFHNTPAALPILGSEKDVKSVSTEDFIKFYNEYYCASNMIVVITGAFNISSISIYTEKIFSQVSTGKIKKRQTISPSLAQKKSIVLSKEVEQCVIKIGFPGVGRGSTNDVSLNALAHILGGGMSSRLFDRVREKMGACYSIYSANCNNYSVGYGNFLIAVGIDLKKFDEVISAIAEEIRILKKKE